jgi:hypothetical protein
LKKIVLTLIVCAGICASNSFAQIRKIPSVVTDSLSAEFPDAKNVEWGDRISVFEATFNMDTHKYQVSFNSKGNWKKTEKYLTEDEVPAGVKEGLNKSKYADEWEVQSYVAVSTVDGAQQYRLLVKKNDVQKKYLYFTDEGRLIRDSITL